MHLNRPIALFLVQASAALFLLPARAQAQVPPLPAFTSTIGAQDKAEIYPGGLDVDPAGNVYVADTGNDAVEAYDALGNPLWRVGNIGLALNPPRFLYPRDLAYLNGDVYVADSGNGRVVVLDATTGTPITAWPGFGSILGISAGVSPSAQPVILVTQDQKNQVQVLSPSGTQVGPGVVGSGPGSGIGQLKAPRDAATDAAGDIYVADYGNNRIAKFAPDGTSLLNWGKKGTLNGQFRSPYGVAVDAAGNVYVADATNDRIQEFNGTGTWEATVGSPGPGDGQFTQLRRVAVGSGSDPLVYAADLWGYRIESFDSASGTYAQTWAGVPPPLDGFNEPSGLTVSGNQVFVADAVNQRIQSYTTDGIFQYGFGHRGWGVDLAGLNWPRDLTYDPITGSLWVADTRNSRITEVSASGVPGRTFGAVGSAAGKLNWPTGVCSLSSGDIIVSDTSNNRVEDWTPTSIGASLVWTATGMKAPSAVACSGTTVYVADTGDKRIVLLNASDGSGAGTIVSSTKIHSPQGIAVESDGNIWIADTTWNRLVEFNPSGNYLHTLGPAVTGTSPLTHPTKLGISGEQLYVADQWNDRVQVFNLGE